MPIPLLPVGGPASRGGTEADAVEQLIYSTLNSDATLSAMLPGGVWFQLAPEGTAFPVAVYTEMSGVDLMTVDSARVWTNFLYLVEVIGQTASYADVRNAAARIDALLHRTSGTVAAGVVWACVRERVMRRLESAPGGQQYRRAGAVYRLVAS